MAKQELPTVQRNLQPVEKCIPENKRSGVPVLEVIDVFYTIQGEGPFSGHPAVFVRLAGCNLQCPACDTDYTSYRVLETFQEIIKRIEVEFNAVMSVVESNDRRTMGKLVVITGGEPFRQANVIPFINVLMNQQYTVQIETNGTVDIPAMALHTKTSIAHWLPTNKAYRKKLVIVCSPKTASIREANAPYIHSFKYVLAAGKISPLDGLPTSALGYNQTVYRPWESSFISQPNIYVTPEDCGGLDWYANEEARQAYQDNLNTASHSATTFGYILGLQIHKYFHLA